MFASSICNQVFFETTFFFFFKQIHKTPKQNTMIVENYKYLRRHKSTSIWPAQ